MTDNAWAPLEPYLEDTPGTPDVSTADKTMTDPKYFVFGSTKDFMGGLVVPGGLTHSMEQECAQNEGGKWKQTKRIDYPSAPSGLNRKERRKRKEGGASGEAEGGGAGAGGETPPERKKPRKEKAEKSESLHPSWEAKKNAKPLVAAFAGTKVTFD